jgi:hypothetical protein
VNDLTPTAEQGRRAYFNEHGHWPRSTPKYSVTFTRRDAPTKAPATPPSVPATPTPFESPEAAAWRAAYASEQGPVGGSWPEDGRHVPYVVWVLPIHTPTHPCTLRNFRRFS